MSGITDGTMDVVAYALGGLNSRAEVRAHNLANVNTPNFRAMKVDFESALETAIDRDDLSRIAAPVETPDMNLPGPNGNTVSVEGEMIGQMKDNLTRSAMVNAFNFKTTAMRTAIGRR